MTHGSGGLDPRITGPASLAQQQGTRERGIPLISDEEAERRQVEADAARRRGPLRRRLLILVVIVFVALPLALVLALLQA